GWGVSAGEPPRAWIVMTVEAAAVFVAGVNVTVALQVGLQGLFVNADAVTPLEGVVTILNVTGAVVPDVRVAVAVSTPPAAPSVIDNVVVLAARLKLKPAWTTSVNVAV